jgi:hypothetical protein
MPRKSGCAVLEPNPRARHVLGNGRLRGEGCRERESVVRPLVVLPQPSLEIALSLIAHLDEFRENAMLVGFARVSARDQNPRLQLDAFQAAGCERVYTVTVV